MKSTIVFLGISLLLSLNSFSQGYIKLLDSGVDKSKVKIAQDFATNYLLQSKKGGYYKIQDEAIEIIKNHLTEQNQKITYQQLKKQFGDFQNLEYAETWIQENNNSMLIIRFKSEFEKSYKKLEVRVIVDDSNKIAGFWIKPWSDMLQ